MTITDDEILSVAAKHCEFTPEGTYHLRRYSGKWAIVQVVRECFDAAWNRRASLEAPLREPQQWIPVSERLPDQDGMPVAVFDPNHVVCKLWPATWDARYGTFSAAGGWFEQDEVTHWTPILAPPLAASPEAAVPMQAKETP